MRKKKYFLIRNTILILFSFILNSCSENAPLTDEELFQKFIINPIPESVTDLIVNRPSSYYIDPVWVMNFHINSSDMQKILQSQPFKEYVGWDYDPSTGRFDWSFDYQNREMYDEIEKYANDIALGLTTLDKDKNGNIKPVWFKLEEWNNPNFYAYQINRDPNVTTHVTIYIIIYNEELSEAYFIRNLVGGL